jgi:uncharacterized protein YuzE
MHLSYDPEVDMGYLYVVDSIKVDEAVTSIPLYDDQLPGGLVVDLDAEGNLLGIEIFNPSQWLRRELLEGAQPPGDRPPE